MRAIVEYDCRYVVLKTACPLIYHDLLKPLKETIKPDDGQLYLDFKYD